MKKDTNIAICIGGAVIALWFTSGFFLYPSQDRGTFGDMFGAVNALFSGLAFVGVVYAILLQKKELELQRVELAETRKEIKLGINVQKESIQFIKAQADSTNQTFQLQLLTSAKIALENQIKYEAPQNGNGSSQRYLRLLERSKILDLKIDGLIDRVIG